MSNLKKIGLFGGTFNPVHNMHIRMTESFCNELNLDKCFFVPAYISPFKSDEQETNPIYPEHRLKMLEFAIESNDKFEIDTFELNQKGISYTINTLKYFQSKYSESDIYLLIGGDQAKYFTEWKDWQEIVKNCHLCIAPRPDSQIINIENIHIDNAFEPMILDLPAWNISSSEIRMMIKENSDVSKIIPENVYDYIITNNLYK